MIKAALLVTFLGLCCAEPPVSSSYLPATRENNGLSAKYGPPSSRSGTHSNEYNVPSSGDSNTLQENYNSKEDLGRHSVPSESSQYSGPSTNYGLPSSDHSSPTVRSGLPSNQYGTPTNIPSAKYGTPQQYSNNGGYNYPSPASPFASHPSTRYGLPDSSSRKIQSQYGVPSSQYERSSPSSQYGLPSAQNSQHNSPSSSFRSGLSGNYGPPSASRSVPSSQYGQPITRLHPSAFTTATLKSPSTTFRVQPSTQYGTPNTRNSVPSSSYGVPSRSFERIGSGYSRSNVHGQGTFNNADLRSGQSHNSVEQDEQYATDLLSARKNEPSEPAKYEYNYDVKEEDLGVDFGQEETRDGEEISGVYHVLLPDRRKQTVKYTAGPSGYKPKITYEDVGESIAARNYEEDHPDHGYQPDNQGQYDQLSRHADQGYTNEEDSHNSYIDNNHPRALSAPY